MKTSYQQALQAIQDGDFEAAIAQLDELIQTDSTQPQVWQAQAVTLLSLGHAGGAIAAVKHAIQLQPDFAAAHRLLGKAHGTLGNQAEAITAYKAATRCYLAQQDKANAQDCLAQIEQLRSEPKPHQSKAQPPQVNRSAHIWRSPPNLLANATTNIQRGRYVDALTDLNWLLQFEPNHLEALKQRSNLHALRHNYQEAINDLAKAIALAPQNPDLRLQRGQMRLKLGDAQGAINDLSDLLSENDVDRVQLYYSRGQAYQRMNEMEKAIEDFSSALDLAPRHADCYRARGNIHETRNDLIEALANYRQAASLCVNQGNWSVHRALQSQIQALESQIQAQQAEENRTVRVPIKHLSGGTPVIEVVFNGNVSFDMVLDTGAAITCLTHQMGHLLNVSPTGKKRFGMADGRIVEESVGFVNSIAVGSAQSNDLQVAIARNAREGLLGQNYLWRYDVRILRTEIELYRR